MAGALPFLAATIAIKAFALESEYITGQSVTIMWERVLTPSRHQEIMQFGLSTLRNMADPVSVVLLVAYLLVRGRADDLLPGFAIGLTILLTACGYYSVYLLTPYPLSWQLSTSANRLLVQLWPSVVFWAILLSGNDEGRSGHPPRVDPRVGGDGSRQSL